MKNRRKKDEDGFTLIETMIVLAFLIFLTFVFYIAAYRIEVEREKREGIDSFEQFMYEAQMLALARTSSIWVSPIPESATILLRDGRTGEELARRELPARFQLSPYSPLKAIHVTATGRVEQFGTMTYYYDDWLIHFRLQFGYGRVTVDVQRR